MVQSSKLLRGLDGLKVILRSNLQYELSTSLFWRLKLPYNEKLNIAVGYGVGNTVVKAHLETNVQTT